MTEATALPPTTSLCPICQSVKGNNQILHKNI
jgi:hypothetical protein